MTKTILTVLAATLLAGSMIEAATASERHPNYVGRRERAQIVNPSYRNSYAEFREPGAYGWFNPAPYYWPEQDQAAMSSGLAGR